VNLSLADICLLIIAACLVIVVVAGTNAI